MGDIRVKLEECKRVENIMGISRPGWFLYLFKALVFKLGRFQYLFGEFKADIYEKDGITLKKGDPVITLHIPESDEKMDDAARENSYKMAYSFFKKYYSQYFYNDCLPLTCNTWLFFEKHREFLGDNSTIVSFMDEFNIIEKYENDGFIAGMWVFGSAYRGNAENYPRNTRMQRAYADWLVAGNKTGTAYGVKLLKYN